MGVGALGPTTEPATKRVEGAPRQEPGENTSFLRACHSFLSGLARVQHLLVEAQPVLEALLKKPPAMISVVVTFYEISKIWF